MRNFLPALLALLTFGLSSRSLAVDPVPLGIVAGVSTGVAGVDFSDGTTRYNIGGIYQNVNFGVQTGYFEFLLLGEIIDFKGSLDDYVADGSLAVKWYFATNMHIMANMSLALWKSSAASGPLTTFTTRTGGGAGGAIGYDFYTYGAGAGGAFRLSIDFGSQRYDFGSSMVRQGENTSNSDLINHMVGMSFFSVLGLEWSL